MALLLKILFVKSNDALLLFFPLLTFFSSLRFDDYLSLLGKLINLLLLLSSNLLFFCSVFSFPTEFATNSVIFVGNSSNFY